MKAAAAAEASAGGVRDVPAAEAAPARPIAIQATGSRTARLWIAAATLVAFGLRIYGIGDLGDLDFDEQASYFIGSMPPPEMLRYLLGAPFEHPPLFYLLFHVWLTLVGGSETAMRIFPVLPGTLTVPLLGLITARIAGSPAGGVAAWALAVSPLHVYYSRDARMYSLLGLLTVVVVAGVMWRLAPGSAPEAGAGPSPIGLPPEPSARAFVGLSKTQGMGPWLIAGAAATAALATHYYAAFIVLGILVGLTRAHHLKPGALLPGNAHGGSGLRWQIIAMASVAAVITVLGLGWLGAASGLRTSLTAVYPRPVDPTTLLAAIIGSLGAPLVSPLTPSSWLPGAALVTAIVIAASLRSSGREVGALRRIALYGFLIPTIGVPLLLIVGRPFAPRFVALATPLLAMLVGLAATRVSRRWLVATTVVALPLAGVGLAPMYGGYTRGDYGRAMAALRAEARADDAVVLNGPWQDLLYRRYGVGLPERSIIASTVPLEPSEAERNLQAIAAVHPRIWVVDAATDIADPNGVVTGWLDRNAYPRPVIPFEKALLRPYLTDFGRAALQERPIVAAALEVQLLAVALDAWQLAPVGETRVRITAAPRPCPAGDAGCEPGPGMARGETALRLSLQLVSSEGSSLWHWDGELSPADTRLEYRAGLTIPPDAAPGRYRLEALVYEALPDGHGGRWITRMAPPLEIGAIEVVRYR